MTKKQVGSANQDVSNTTNETANLGETAAEHNKWLDTTIKEIELEESQPSKDIALHKNSIPLKTHIFYFPEF